MENVKNEWFCEILIAKKKQIVDKNNFDFLMS